MNLIYKTPKDDLIILMRNKLKDMGLTPEEIAIFSANSAIPLSLQVTAFTNWNALATIQDAAPPR
jgi:hypothetical protein